MLVKFNFEFEFNEEGLDPRFVDIKNLARATACGELKNHLNSDEITYLDFEVIEKEQDEVSDDEVFLAARLAGADATGDVIVYKGSRYYVNCIARIVWKIL